MSRRSRPAAVDHVRPPQAPRPLQPLTRPLLRTNNRAYVAAGTRFAFRHSQSRGGSSVLKITRLSQKGRGLTIKLEGELLGPWVGSVRDACSASGRRPRHLRLDLAVVTFVDAAGIQLLRDLVAEGAELAACSSFVGELL